MILSSMTRLYRIMVGDLWICYSCYFHHVLLVYVYIYWIVVRWHVWHFGSVQQMLMLVNGHGRPVGDPRPARAWVWAWKRTRDGHGFFNGSHSSVAGTGLGRQNPMGLCPLPTLCMLPPSLPFLPLLLFTPWMLPYVLLLDPMSVLWCIIGC